MSDRPDLIADVLEAARFSTLYFGRTEVRPPWAFAVPAKPTSSFYLVLEGEARVTLGAADASAVALRAGDLVLLPRCEAHRLDDGSARGRRMPARPSHALGGGTAEGAGTTIVSGCFRFADGTTHPFLRALPPALHFPAAEASPLLRALVGLVALESAQPSAGSSVILARLTDCLLVHALRSRSAAAGDGLRALADPAIATAIARMHADPGAPWTVERLAAAAGLSRSGFAARFEELVGEPPLRYLTRWRMTKAATWLAETRDSVDAIAARLGYESGPAFQKAFKRVRGMGPGAFRRTVRVAAA